MMMVRNSENLTFRKPNPMPVLISWENIEHDFLNLQNSHNYTSIENKLCKRQIMLQIYFSFLLRTVIIIIKLHIWFAHS